MIDRFDPAALEKELEALGLLETLLAGGRRAKLWELYQKRFREIAQSAETQFLGEVGADFREAYERGGTETCDRRAFLALAAARAARGLRRQAARPGGGHRRRHRGAGDEPGARRRRPAGDAVAPAAEGRRRLQCRPTMFALQEDPAAALAADLLGMDQLAVAAGRHGVEDRSPSSPRRPRSGCWRSLRDPAGKVWRLGDAGGARHAGDRAR